MESTKSSSSTAGTQQKRHDPYRFNIGLDPDLKRVMIGRASSDLTFGVGDLANLNRRFITVLDRLRRATKKDLEVKAEERDACLQELKAAGLIAYNTVISEKAHEDLRKIETEVVGGRDVALTLMSPPGWKLFWELLYMSSEGEMPTDEAVWDQFWGFRYALGRDIGSDHDRIAIHKGIFSSLHKKLDGSRREVLAVAKHIAALCATEGLSLAVQLLDEEPNLCRLPNPSTDDLFKLFMKPEFRYGILHFACHCEEPLDGDVLESNLRMTIQDKPLDLSLDILKQYERLGLFKAYRPLVFLNACGSSTADHLLQSFSIPSGFLKNQAGGVIATACTMPDTFAEAFGTYFYKCLFQQDTITQEAHIGQALLETRRHFWQEYGNPLGLAYGLHAYAHQKLTFDI